MSNDEYLGEFEHLVLLAILQVGEEAYGVPIRSAIIERAQRSVSFGAVYSTLRRLERKGYVRSRASDPDPVPGGRSKKLFEVLPAGLTVLRASQGRLARMSNGLERVLKAEPHRT